MSTLVRAFYVSAIVKPLSDVDVQVILGAAQMKNRRVDVTGMLAQSNGHFAQVLEGRHEAVQETLARVARDVRHNRVRVLLEEAITRRQFERWAMAWAYQEEIAHEMRLLHECDLPDAERARALLARLVPSDVGWL